MWCYKQTKDCSSVQGPSLHHFIFAHTSQQSLDLCWFITHSGLRQCGFSFHPPRLTSTEVNRFTGSTHIWDKYVFHSGWGLIHRDQDQVGWHCVFVISAERLWMIGVSDTVCFLPGRSSQIGQTGGTRVCEKRAAAFICLSSFHSHIHRTHEQFLVFLNSLDYLNLCYKPHNELVWTSHECSCFVISLERDEPQIVGLAGQRYAVLLNPR